MAKEVIKKDGSKQPFDSEKIKKAVLATAAVTDLSEERKNEIADQVTAAVIQIADAKEEISTSEIREIVLSELDNVAPVVSEAWRAHDAEKKGV